MTLTETTFIYLTSLCLTVTPGVCLMFWCTDLADIMNSKVNQYTYMYLYILLYFWEKSSSLIAGTFGIVAFCATSMNWLQKWISLSTAHMAHQDRERAYVVKNAVWVLIVLFIAVKRQCDMEMLPLECHYLNKSALISVVGQQVILCCGHLACCDS